MDILKSYWYYANLRFESIALRHGHTTTEYGSVLAPTPRGG